MESLTVDTLRVLARAQGLELTDPELAAVLPLVEATRAMMGSLREVALGEMDPAVQYRIL
jgi:hypothetical protein